jgi:hypothetical protein
MGRYVWMIQSPRLTICASLFAAVLVAPFTEAANAAPGFAADLERALKEVDQNLCRSVESLKCKRKAPASRAGSKKAKAKPAAAGEPEKPATEKAPIPRQKPARKPEAESAEVPRPRMKPALPEAESAETTAPIPKAKPAQPEAEAKSQVSVRVPPAAMPKMVNPPHSQPDAACRAALASLGMNFAMPPTPVNSGLCTVADPVKLTSFSIGGESIAFPDGPVLNCSFAVRFGEWLKAEGVPIVKRTTGSAFEAFYTGPGYQCRGRNGDGTAKISEHGYGNAVDITFFKLKDGRTFQVKDALDPMSPAYQTLADIRASGCKHFTTVLGPGSNAAHADHFHFDMGKHGKSGTFRICE